MRFVESTLRSGREQATLVGEFTEDGSDQLREIQISVPSEYESFLDGSPENFLPALLLPAMHRREDLTIEGRVDPRLLRQSGQVQEILVGWYDDLTPVQIHAEPGSPEPRTPASGIGSFFSGGVDSFHTLIESQSGHIPLAGTVTHIVYVRSTAGSNYRGFGVPLRVSDDTAFMEREMIEVARQKKVEIIPVDMNMQALFPNFNWDTHYHGAAMATLAHCLSRGIGLQIISSSFTYPNLRPWGSHPMTDPLWSSDKLRLYHYGCHVSRAEKAADVVGNDPVAMEHLRVCLYDAAKNCGKCQKCVRTMISLDIAGKLNAAKTLPHEMPAHFENALDLDRDTYVDELQWLAHKYNHRKYIEFFGRYLARRTRRRAIGQFLQATPLLRRLNDPLRRARKLFRRELMPDISTVMSERGLQEKRQD